MVLRTIWGRLGLLFGALEWVLGSFFGLGIDPEALLTIGSATSWALFGLLLSLLAASSCFSFREIVVSSLGASPRRF